MTSRAAVLMLALILSAGPAPPAVPGEAGGEASEVWAPLRPLLGRWVGQGSGFGAVSDVEHEWRFVIQGHFLELRTRSTRRAGPAEQGETHEDVGLMSRDTDEGRFVFRQFLSEGFVNTYDVSVRADGAPEIVFRHRESEGSGEMRAQMRLAFTGVDEYEMTLDLAAAGKDFTPCQTMLMRRTR